MKNIQSFTIVFLGIAVLSAVVVLPAACAGFAPHRQARDAAAGLPAETGASVQANGVYEGVGRGRRGPVLVRVRMEGGNIAEIEIIDSSEDQFVGGAAMEELLEQALMYNTTDLDAISGATESSKGFLAALENAIMAHK